MNVFFDVQGTLVSGGVTRPGAREVFDELVTMGHHVYLWSSAGSGYAEKAADFLEARDLIFGCFGKNPPPPVSVDFAVDDSPGIFHEYDGLIVSAFTGDPDDDELRRVVERLCRDAD